MIDVYLDVNIGKNVDKHIDLNCYYYEQFCTLIATTHIFSCDGLSTSESHSMENQTCLTDKELEGLPWMDCSWGHIPYVGSQVRQLSGILTILTQMI